MDTNAVAIPKPTIPESPEITEILVLELSTALAGKKTSQQALDDRGRRHGQAARGTARRSSTP